MIHVKEFIPEEFLSVQNVTTKIGKEPNPLCRLRGLFEQSHRLENLSSKPTNLFNRVSYLVAKRG
jgi:hypothetical protein